MIYSSISFFHPSCYAASSKHYGSRVVKLHDSYISLTSQTFLTGDSEDSSSDNVRSEFEASEFVPYAAFSMY